MVVVGAGSTGCLVAARLAEAGQDVLLLEAGPDLRGREPAEFRDGWSLCREHAWGFVSEPDGAGTTTPLLRTKLVGGNAWLTRFAVRNDLHDYDRWDRTVGGGWGRHDVTAAFNAIERDLEYGAEPWHGDRGPIPVTRYPDVGPSEFDAVVREALRQCGFAEVADLNRPGALGFGRMPMNSIEGRRVTTVDLLNGQQPNLTVRGDQLVVDVVFNRGAVVGVRLLDGSIVRTDTVVLTAGVYGTPALLMRSGVGPAELLSELGIAIHADLPGVGANLRDHPAVSLDLGYRGTQRAGPLLHTLATFASPHARDDEGPDLAIWCSDPEDDPAEGWLEVLLWRPTGRGHVRIVSSDPTQPPRITLPIPTDDDVAVLSHGVREATNLLSSPTLRSLCRASPTDVPPQPDLLHEWIRANVYSIPHTVGTCAMGARPESGAVVDASGQVYGVSGLSVADASILPGPPTGFPHLVAVMMASRIVDRLLSSSNTTP